MQAANDSVPGPRATRDWVWAPWSIVAWLFAFGIMTTAFLMAAVFLPFVRFERFQPWFPAPMMSWVLRLTLSRIRVRYHRAFDHRRVSVFVQNHVSMLDAHVACTAIPQVFCGLENAAHLRLPGYGWLLRAGNAIPVRPRRDTGGFDEIRSAFRERANRGISVLTFPEAHRTLDGHMRSFRRGVFFIARDTGLPIVPVAVRGMYHVLPKGTWLIKPGDVQIYVGPQFETADLNDEEVERLVDDVQRIMSAWVERGEDTFDAAGNDELEPPVARAQ